MHVKFYCDLYVSQGWQRKKATLKRKLKKRNCFPPFISLHFRRDRRISLSFSLLFCCDSMYLTIPDSL